MPPLAAASPPHDGFRQIIADRFPVTTQYITSRAHSVTGIGTHQPNIQPIMTRKFTTGICVLLAATVISTPDLWARKKKGEPKVELTQAGKQLEKQYAAELEALKKVFGTRNDRELKRMGKMVKQINALADDMKALSDEQLEAAGITDDMVRISVGLETLDDILWDLDQALAASQK